MNDEVRRRLERQAGVPGLAQILAERLSPSDLQSLLIDVYARMASRITPSDVLKHYERSGYVAPSSVDARRMLDLDTLAWQLLPAGYVPLELAPLCPLGASATVGPVSQNKIVSTIRNTEVMADSTNAMALECALRRRDLLREPSRRDEPVRLAASHRLVRAQGLSGPRAWRHFRALAMCAAGRDDGDLRFECRNLVDQLTFLVTLIERAATLQMQFRDIRIAVTDLTAGGRDLVEQQVIAPLKQRFPDVIVHADPTREAGRGYYQNVCFKLYAKEKGGTELELGDGGDVPWTRKLLSNAKERMVICGLGTERVCA